RIFEDDAIAAVAPDVGIWAPCTVECDGVRVGCGQFRVAVRVARIRRAAVEERQRSVRQHLAIVREELRTDWEETEGHQRALLLAVASSFLSCSYSDSIAFMRGESNGSSCGSRCAFASSFFKSASIASTVRAPPGAS